MPKRILGREGPSISGTGGNPVWIILARGKFTGRYYGKRQPVGTPWIWVLREHLAKPPGLVWVVRKLGEFLLILRKRVPPVLPLVMSDLR